ncbi:hypothetical protein BY996DRAFT_2114762 [Phakopsora pachyrhizi]|nr:hypothetical protein BY996DRAFT_2114762 [Phakopsora pachyrhizi]
MRNNEPARNYNLNFQINTHLRDLLDNFKVNAQLPTELDEQFSDVIKFLKDSTFKNDNEKHVIENIQKKIASLSEQLVKKIYTDLPPEEMNKYERGRKLTEQLIEYLVTVHGDASISNLLEDENIVKLIASEFHSFTMNRAYLVNVKQKSFKEIFLGSDLSNDLENIFKCFKKVEFQKNYNSIVEQYILLEASFLDQLQPNILTKLKSLFSNSNSGDKELASRELVEDLIHIKNLPTFEQASPEFGTKFDEAGKYYTLYFIIDYLIHYHGWLPKIKKITGFKLLQILERFLFVYPNDIRKPLMLEFEKDPVKVQKFQKKFHMKAKELNEEEMKSSIYNLVFGWSYRLDTYKEKS